MHKGTLTSLTDAVCQYICQIKILTCIYRYRRVKWSHFDSRIYFPVHDKKISLKSLYFMVSVSFNSEDLSNKVQAEN